MPFDQPFLPNLDWFRVKSPIYYNCGRFGVIATFEASTCTIPPLAPYAPPICAVTVVESRSTVTPRNLASVSSARVSVFLFAAILTASAGTAYFGLQSAKTGR